MGCSTNYSKTFLRKYIVVSYYSNSSETQQKDAQPPRIRIPSLTSTPTKSVSFISDFHPAVAVTAENRNKSGRD